MSIIDQEDRGVGGKAARWVAYGLSAVGLLLPFAPARFGGDGLAVATLMLPALVFALLLMAPEAFGRILRGTRIQTISLAPLLPVFALAMSSLQTGRLDIRYALAPTAVCSAIAVLLGLGAASRPMPGGLAATVIFLALFGAAYGYGALMYADVRFDHAVGQMFEAKVQDRNESHARGGPSYRLTLAPWGPVTAPVSATVTAQAYARLNPGDTACVTLYPGALGMAWYRAGLCPAD